MNIIEIDIPPKSKTIILSRARIIVREITLFCQCAYVNVVLLDDNGNIQDCHTFKHEHDDFINCKEVQYLIDWVKNKLLTI